MLESCIGDTKTLVCELLTAPVVKSASDVEKAVAEYKQKQANDATEIATWKRSDRSRSTRTECPDCGKAHSTVMKPSTAAKLPKSSDGVTPLVKCHKCKVRGATAPQQPRI